MMSMVRPYVDTTLCSGQCHKSHLSEVKRYLQSVLPPRGSKLVHHPKTGVELASAVSMETAVVMPRK